MSTFSVDMEKELSDIYDEWLTVPEADGGFDAESEPRKIFVSAWELWAGVLWSGFCAGFGNAGESLKYAQIALATIGATASLNLLQEALALIFPAGLPSTVEEASKQAWTFYASDDTEGQKIGIRCDELDQEFFEYKDDLPALLYAFVLKHPEEFGKRPELTNRQGTW